MYLDKAHLRESDEVRSRSKKTGITDIATIDANQSTHVEYGAYLHSFFYILILQMCYCGQKAFVVNFFAFVVNFFLQKQRRTTPTILLSVTCIIIFLCVSFLFFFPCAQPRHTCIWIVISMT